MKCQILDSHPDNKIIPFIKRKKKEKEGDKRVTIKLMFFCRRAHLSFIEFY